MGRNRFKHAKDFLHLILICCFSLGLGSNISAAAPLDLSNPDDALKATRKINCSLKDGVPTVLTWSGKMYSRIEGVPDKHLFNTEAFSIRNCKTYQDDERGYGFRIIAREIMLYLDPKTNEILRTWENPWTKEVVDVIPIANDPMSFPFPFYARGTDGTPHKFEGILMDGKVQVMSEKILFGDSPLGGDYQDYVGGKYHASEIFHFFMEQDELLGDTDEVMNLFMSNTRVSKWLPWMKMGGRQGLLIFHGTGQKLANFEALSDRLKNEVAQSYPVFSQPPALDDFRPMKNSTTKFKEIVDTERAAQSQKETR